MSDAATLRERDQRVVALTIYRLTTFVFSYAAGSYVFDKVGDRAASASSARRLMARGGWSFGTRCSGESIVACFVSVPRIGRSSVSVLRLLYQT